MAPPINRWARYAQSPAQAARFLFYLPRTLSLIGRLMRDSRVGFHAKILPPLAVLYVVYPLDLVRDLPFIGYIDDILVVYYLLKTFFRLCPQEVVQEHVQALSAKKQ